jgi:hypothetical protein
MLATEPCCSVPKKKIQEAKLALLNMLMPFSVDELFIGRFEDREE